MAFNVQGGEIRVPIVLEGMQAWQQLKQAAANAVNALRGVDLSVERIKNGLTRLGPIAGKAFLAYGGAATAVIHQINAINAASDFLRARTGKIGDEFQDVFGAVRRSLSKTASDVMTVADVVKILTIHLNLSGKDLEDLTERLTAVNDVMGENVAEEFARTVKFFGLTRDEYSALLNTAVKVSQEIGGSVADVLASARTLNLLGPALFTNWEKAFGAIAKAKEAGVEVEQAKRAVVGLVVALDQMAAVTGLSIEQVWERLGAVMAQDTAQAKELQKILFGSTVAGAAARKLFEVGAFDPRAIQDAGEQLKRSAEDVIHMREAVLSADSAFSFFMNNVQRGLAPLVEDWGYWGQVGRQAAKQIGDGLEWVTSAFMRLPGVVRTAIEGFSLFAAGVSAGTLGLGLLQRALEFVGLRVDLLGTAWRAIAATFGVVWRVAGFVAARLTTVGAVIAGAAAWAKVFANWRESIAGVAAIWDVLTGKVGVFDVWRELKREIGDALGIDVNALEVKFDQALGVIFSFAGKVIDKFSELKNAVTDTAKSIAQSVAGWFSWLGDTLVFHSIVPDMAQEIVAVFRDMYGRLGVLSQDYFTAELERVKKQAEAIVDAYEEAERARITATRKVLEAAGGAGGTGGAEGLSPELQRAMQLAGLTVTGGAGGGGGKMVEKEVAVFSEEEQKRMLDELAAKTNAMRDAIANAGEELVRFFDIVGQADPLAALAGQVFDVVQLFERFGGLTPTVDVLDAIGAKIGVANLNLDQMLMLHERLTEVAGKLGGVYERVADGLLEWWRAAQKAKNATDAVATSTVAVKKSFADMWAQMDAGERAMAILDGIGRVLAALPQKFRKVAQAADVGFNIVRDAIEIAKGNLLAFFDILAQVLSLLGIFGDKVEKEKSAFEKMKEELSDALEDFSRRFAETLATLVREGKAQFGDLVDYILNKLLEITLYYTISYPIEQGIRAAFKGLFFKGGVFNGGGVVPMARGAVITGPVVAPMALMGERGPEAVLPLKRFADGSLGVRAETTGGGVVVNVFNNAGGVEVDTRTTRAADGTRAVEIFVREAVRAGLMRGDFDAEMRSMYGVRRLGFA